MKFNVFKVCDGVLSRIDGVSMFNVLIKTCTSLPKSKVFFNNDQFLKKYVGASQTKKLLFLVVTMKKLLSSFYYGSICRFGPYGLVVRVLDSQYTDFSFKTTKWLQGRPSLSSIWGRVYELKVTCFLAEALWPWVKWTPSIKRGYKFFFDQKILEVHVKDFNFL